MVYEIWTIKSRKEGQIVNITNIKYIGIIENILVNPKYNNEICVWINTHKITLNNEAYYVKGSCKEIQKGKKQARISDEDLEIINKTVEKYR